MRVPLMFVPLEKAPTLGRRFRGLGMKVLGLYPVLKYDLRDAKLEVEPESYGVVALFSALIWGVIFLVFGRVVALARAAAFPEAAQLGLPLVLGFCGFFFFLALHLYYPRIIAQKVAESINRELIFAARDLLIQVSSGISLYTAMTNIANASYGEVSREFSRAVSDVRSGASMVVALENMAVRTKSEYLKKTAWQLVTAIRAGANLSTALRSTVNTLVRYHFQLTKNYNAELNFLVLIYLLLAAVVPTVGVTVLIIFSVFGILGITPELFGAVIALSFVSQMALTGYIYTRRPVIY